MKRLAGIVLRIVRIVLRIIGYALLAYIVASISLDLFQYIQDGFPSDRIETFLLTAIAFATAIYFWIARKFLDRIGFQRRWPPFARDLLNLACFLVVAWLFAAAALATAMLFPDIVSPQIAP